MPNTIAHLSRSTPVHSVPVRPAVSGRLRSARRAAGRTQARCWPKLSKPSERIHVSDIFTVDGEAMLEAARAHGLEGIVAKARGEQIRRPAQPRLGQDQSRFDGQEFVIGGFTHGEREYFSSLVLGVYDDGKLVHTGQVGTGFNEKSLKEIYGKIEPLITKKSPFSGPVKALRDVTWVRAGAGRGNQVSRNHSGRTAPRASVCRAAYRQRPEGMRARNPAAEDLQPETLQPKTLQPKTRRVDSGGFAHGSLARNRQAIA